jgi:hypothetical protein
MEADSKMLDGKKGGREVVGCGWRNWHVEV